MFAVFTLLVGAASPLLAQNKDKDLRKALSFKPRQAGVNYDRPSEREIASCRIASSAKDFGSKGYVVYDASGRTLRLIMDTDGNGKIDRWSFFRDGIEVYRDLDTNGDLKTDQYRWLGTGGTRWGLDKDQDGKIDGWKRISAEEVAFEVFEAIRTKDASRFQRLLPTTVELTSLGLGDQLEAEVKKRVRTATAKFSGMAKQQKRISSSSKFVHFGSTRPSLVPEGHLGSRKDVEIYDQATAVFESKDFGSLSLGTLIKSGDAWLVTELPQIVQDNTVVTAGNYFYPMPDMSTAQVEPQSPEMQKLVELYGKHEELQKQIAKAVRPAEITRLETELAELHVDLAKATKGEDQKNWIRQMSDTLTASFQNDRFENGLRVLSDNMATLKKAGINAEQDYAAWRILNSKYSKRVSEGTTKQQREANEVYIRDMKAFVEDFPKSGFAPDAIMQLAWYIEVSERDELEQAIALYKRAAREFPGTLVGKRAAGAVVRLTSQDKKIEFIGKDTAGRTFRLSNKSLRGKIVVIHYWESWCDACVEAFEELERLSTKHNSDLVVVAANLDSDIKKLEEFRRKNASFKRCIHLHGPGGFEKSELATQLGVTTLPLTLLVDQQGNLVEGNVPVDDLDREIQRLIRRAGVASNPKEKQRK